MIVIPWNTREYPKIPTTVAGCPICGAEIVIEAIDEWETETGRATDGGLHVDCSTAPDVDSDEFDDYMSVHWSMPYVDWMPVEDVVRRWFNGHYRITDGVT